MTSPTDDEIDSRILALLQRRMPEATADDLGRLLYYDLDVDSLDVVDLTHTIEEEYGLTADLDRVSSCQTFIDYRAYIRELLDAK
jgi:acyl carrier protein